MGNCMKKQPAIQSHRDIKGSPATLQGKRIFSGNDRDDSRDSLRTATTEVKIKISKKQLQELVGKTNMQGLTVEQVLARLINASDTFESHQRSWRPALQSIPE